MKLKCAVLLIGSLFWDDNQADAIDFRKKWRKNRLAMNQKIHVKSTSRFNFIKPYLRNMELDDLKDKQFSL